MKRFVEGEDRSQVTLLPACLDDYVEAENPVRVVEVFVDGLDLGELGFVGVAPAATGRPAYHPAVLLKLYIYGYLNRVQSSRRLEREAQRNVELMWLTGRLRPDFKTIANFRKDNGRAIRNVCRQFIVLCRQLNLFTEAIGIYRAKYLSLTGNFLSAEQAYAWGLVSHVVPPEQLEETALVVAKDMLSVMPHMLEPYKALIDDGFAGEFGTAMDLESRRSASHIEAMGAWTGARGAFEAVRERGRGQQD